MSKIERFNKASRANTNKFLDILDDEIEENKRRLKGFL